ncbi:MAG: biopolymer transporter ExbD [Planctomycetes bacterium]|nr:biopolymer transporter ExbD [Planctomycetota bacterium]
MKFTSRRRLASTVINLTPLIDCMFLLVIFIMIAARFEPESGIAVDLPKARAGEAQKIESINLVITSDGRIFFDMDEVAVEDLERRIVETRTAAGDPDGEDIVLVLHGDKDAQHGRIVEVLDAAARARQKKVTIRTRQ